MTHSHSRRSATDAVFLLPSVLAMALGWLCEIGLRVAIKTKTASIWLFGVGPAALEISLERFNLSWFDGTDEFGGPPDFPKAVAILMANVADECSTHDKEFSKQLFPPVSVRRQPVRCS